MTTALLVGGAYFVPALFGLALMAGVDKLSRERTAGGSLTTAQSLNDHTHLRTSPPRRRLADSFKENR